METSKKISTGPWIPVERITQSILFIRSQKVMVDADLATLYGVETRVLVQAGQEEHRPFSRGFHVPTHKAGI